jgi:hypothetical protein
MMVHKPCCQPASVVNEGIFAHVIVMVLRVLSATVHPKSDGDLPTKLWQLLHFFGQQGTATANAMVVSPDRPPACTSNMVAVL